MKTKWKSFSFLSSVCLKPYCLCILTQGFEIYILKLQQHKASDPPSTGSLFDTIVSEAVSPSCHQRLRVPDRFPCSFSSDNLTFWNFVLIWECRWMSSSCVSPETRLKSKEQRAVVIADISLLPPIYKCIKLSEDEQVTCLLYKIQTVPVSKKVTQFPL